MSFPIGKNKSIEEHRNRIAKSWKKATEGIIETGLYLIEAEKSLGKIGFRHLRRDLEDSRIMSSSVISKIMGIARNPVLTNPDYRPHLPPSYATLYLLSLQDQAALESKIVDHEITPDTEQKEVKELFGTPRAPVNSEENTSGNKIVFKGDFSSVVDNDWTSLLRILKRLKKSGVKIEGIEI